MRSLTLPTLSALAAALTASVAGAQIGFQPAASVATPSQPDASVLADLDGDGDLDLAVTTDAPELELQRDGGQSLDDIAKSVGSSKTPVWNRIRKMKEAGIIGQQTVLLDAEKLGFEACFFVLIRTSEHEAAWQAAFLRALPPQSP